MKELVKGIIPPMLTAFHDDGSIDEQRTRGFVNFLVDNGVDGISPAGSTGEMIALTWEERKKVIEIVINEAKGRVPVYPATMHYSTDLTIELSRFAEQKGADGVLIIPPYYLNPPKHDALNHYRDLRQNIGIPIILYDNVWFTGYEFDQFEIAGLVDEGVLQGIKCAHGDPWKVHTLRYMCDKKLTIYYGHDVNALEALLTGADGLLTGMLNLIPKLASELYAATSTEDIAQARTLWNKMIPLVNFVCVNRKDNYPHFVQIFKDGLKMIGKDVGIPRKPLTPLKEPEKKRLNKILKDLDLL